MCWSSIAAKGDGTAERSDPSRSTLLRSCQAAYARDTDWWTRRARVRVGWLGLGGRQGGVRPRACTLPSLWGKTDLRPNSQKQGPEIPSSLAQNLHLSHRPLLVFQPQPVRAQLCQMSGSSSQKRARAPFLAGIVKAEPSELASKRAKLKLKHEPILSQIPRPSKDSITRHSHPHLDREDRKRLRKRLKRLIAEDHASEAHLDEDKLGR
jgi:hypothetical protein